MRCLSYAEMENRMKKKSHKQLLLAAGLLVAGSLLTAGLFHRFHKQQETLPEHVYRVEYSPTSVMEQEEEACFWFLWDHTNTDLQSPGYGLVLDRSSNPSMCSVASVGYALAGCVIGVERGYISEEEARERVMLTLTTLFNHAQQVEGFFYHFLDMNTAKRYGNCEVSIIDTAIAVNGALCAGEYFGGEIKELAEQIYLRVNWDWYRNPETNQFYMEYLPENGYHTGSWGVYAEQLMLYFLGTASPTHPVPSDMLYQISRESNLWIGMPAYWMSPANSLFTHQYSHAWFPLENTVDLLGTDWFANSTAATLQARQFCIDTSSVFQTFHSNSWGLTACDGPKGYSGGYGANPNNQNDGTIAPCGAAGSAPFSPEYVAEAFEYYYSIEGLTGTYGLIDAYNLEGNSPKFMKDYLGIDKGISLVMLENLRSGLIWKLMSGNPYVQAGMKLVGITKAGELLIENNAERSAKGIDCTVTADTGLSLLFLTNDTTGELNFSSVLLPKDFTETDAVRFQFCGEAAITAKLYNRDGTLLSESKTISFASKEPQLVLLEFPKTTIDEEVSIHLSFASKQNNAVINDITLLNRSTRIRNVYLSERPYIGSPLHAEFDFYTETLADNEHFVTYEWQKSDSPTEGFVSIPGGNQSHYTPQETDAGQFLRVIITPVNAKGEAIGIPGISTNFCSVSKTIPTALDSILTKVQHNKPSVDW